MLSGMACIARVQSGGGEGGAYSFVHTPHRIPHVAMPLDSSAAASARPDLSSHDGRTARQVAKQTDTTASADTFTQLPGCRWTTQHTAHSTQHTHTRLNESVLGVRTLPPCRRAAVPGPGRRTGAVHGARAPSPRNIPARTAGAVRDGGGPYRRQSRRRSYARKGPCSTRRGGRGGRRAQPRRGAAPARTTPPRAAPPRRGC